MPRVGEMPKLFCKASRRTVLGGLAALGASGSAGTTAKSSPAGWPEFQRWYALLLEEERIYNENPAEERDRLLDAMFAERDPLESAMLARQPANMTEFAQLAVIEMRYAERYLVSGVPDCRMLVFGSMERPEYRDGWVQGRHLIEGILRLALAENLLPGVTVHGEGGNA